MNALRYNYQVNVYTQTQRVEVVQSCNSITITNIGDTIATVDGMILYPGTPGTSLGDSRTIGGNQAEILHKKEIVLQFDVPVGASPKIEIIQKFYTR